MNLLVNTLFVSLFAAEYFAAQLGVVPRHFILLPELLSGIALLLVVGRVMTGKRVALEMRYGVFLALYSFTLLFGFLAQDVPTGAVISGLRNYAKFLPFFLIPLVYSFTPDQVRSQVTCLLTLIGLQVPLSTYQRFVQFGDSLHTGDPIRGLSTSSSTLSLLLLSAIACVVALYMRKKLRLRTMLITVALLFLPTTLNETKGTLLLLPLALFVPAIVMPRGNRSFARMLPVVAVASIAVLSFAAVYNHFARYSEYSRDIESFLVEGHAENYLYTGAADGRDVYIGRLDSIVIALRTLRSDPFALVFGLGAGNASMSTVSGFEGRYAEYFLLYGVDTTQVTTFLWEIGIFGLAVVLLLFVCSLRDALYLSRSAEGTYALLGQIWASVALIMLCALLYKEVFKINELVYLFWFYAGLVASKAFEVRRRVRSASLQRLHRHAESSTRWPEGAVEDPGKALS